MACLKTAIGSAILNRKEAMKNNVFIIISLLLFVAMDNISAQIVLPARAMETNYNERFVFGLKGGINCPRLYYTNHYVSDLPHDFIIGLSSGFFMEFPVSNHLAIAPEFNYQQRGGSTTYEYEHDYLVHYCLKANYTSLRLPVLGYWQITRNIRPYLMLGPDWGYVINGDFSLSQPGLDIPESYVKLNNSNMDFFYFGLLGGAGVRFNLIFSGITLIIKTDAAINFGLTDTFSKNEHDETANPTNTHAYNHQGKRLSRGLEISFSIGYIPEKKDDVCDHFRLFRGKQIETIW